MPLRASLHRAVVVALMGVALAACTTQPFSITPSTAVQHALERELEDSERGDSVSAARPRVVSICYGGAINSQEEVLEEARLACPDGELTFRENDYFWNHCALFQPVRASFICTPGKTPAEAPAPE